MKKVLFVIIFLFVGALQYAQTCSNDIINNGNLSGAAPFCSDTGLTFCNSLLLDQVNGTNDAVTSAPTGPFYDCLISQPFPSWFFIRIDQPGNLDLTISQFDTAGAPIDVDFIVWGPYTEPQIDDIRAGNTTLLSPGNVRDCSYLPDAVEFLNVSPVVSGDYYVILITNFAGRAGTIEMENTNPGDPNAGSTDCSIIAGDLGSDQDVCEGETVTLDGTPTTGTAVAYRWFLDEGAGFNELVGETDPMLVINDNRSGTYRVEVTDADGNMAEDDVIITFFPQPRIGTLPFTTFEQCDIDNNVDGFFPFNLTNLFSDDLLDGQDPTIFQVVYYNSLDDANNNVNPLGTTYTNDIAFAPDEIFARVIITVAQDLCTPAIVSFNLLVRPVPEIQNASDYELCDDDVDGDDLNGIVQNFVLSTKDAEILGTLNPADFTVSYHLSAADAENNANALDSANPIANSVANLEPIFVRLTDNNSGCFSFTNNPHFNLVVHPLPVIDNDPVVLEVCDTDQNGQASFNLTDANPFISSNFANESFRYYPTELDAQNNTLEILNPTNYTNPNITNDAVWVRTISVNGCLRISRIDLEVTNTVIPTSFERTFEVCDDYLDTFGNNNANNDDMDGIASFDFSSVTAEIVALFPSNQTIHVSYYETLADANVPQNPIADISNFRNSNSPNLQQIFIRVENPANTTCVYVGTHITLIVEPVPSATTANNMDICDDDNDGDDTNGFVQSIDLESQSADILNGQNPANFTVTYHESAADATAGANALVSPYTNTTAVSQTIYVRVTENASGCYTDRTSFEVNIRPLPTITDSVQLLQCDDDTDGRSPFNLNEANSLISDNFANESFEFFETLADAQNGTNAIGNPTAFVNNIPTNDRVWARAISSFGCFRIAEVNLVVATSSSVVQNFPPETYNVCDDFLDEDGNNTAANDDTDGITSFDFSDFTNPLIQAFPPSERPNLIVNYYRNQADALAELNPISDPSNYRNIGYPNTQQIYVRVDNTTNNDCVGIVALITLQVDPVPVANAVPDLELCDNSDDGDFTNGFVQTFDLSSQTLGILGTQDPSVYTVSYHETAADASAGTNAITNTTSYTNAVVNQQTIYVRVTHNIQGCYTDRSTFDLIVNPLPVANFVPDLQVCDDGTGGSTQNGFTSNINLELQTAGILGTQDPNNFTVTYHTSFANAQTGVNAIVSPFANTDAFTQTIYIRIVNNTTLCANDISNFNVIVNREPTVEDVGDLMVCDDDADGDDTNGFVQNINLDSRIPLILGPSQDEDDYTVTFHETQADADAGMNALSSPYANTTANSQTLYIRVTYNDTGCYNANESFNIIVNPLPDFEVTSPQIVCLNGPELTLAVENPAGIYDYVWTDPVGNTIIGSQLSVTVGGLYLITATTTDGTQCSRTREIVVNESIIATFTDADVTIIDDSDNNSISIDPTNLGIGDYEYALEDENGDVLFPFQDDPLFENLEGGFYTVLVRDKNGCGQVSLDVNVVEFPKFFTPNNDGVNDTWAIKGANSLFFPGSEINIFNRFGKLVAQISIDNPGWNGTFNGKILPSDDYWFSIKLVDRNGQVRERQGNLSLLRR